MGYISGPTKKSWADHKTQSHMFRTFTESVVYTQFNQLHAPVTVFMFGCSGTQISDPENRIEGLSHPGEKVRTS